mmetsp:Transcript_43426/g.120746  ORF Transcript_43426/g.120746 Transcript_43426/m.120746 type:complete len:211 (+) Transcript_43426:760-1392(+)
MALRPSLDFNIRARGFASSTLPETHIDPPLEKYSTLAPLGYASCSSLALTLLPLPALLTPSTSVVESLALPSGGALTGRSPVGGCSSPFQPALPSSAAPLGPTTGVCPAAIAASAGLPLNPSHLCTNSSSKLQRTSLFLRRPADVENLLLMARSGSSRTSNVAIIVASSLEPSWNRSTTLPLLTRRILQQHQTQQERQQQPPKSSAANMA